MLVFLHTINTHNTLRTRIRYFFVAFSLFGFVIFDMVYLSVIITYASQSELIQFYITGIIDKVNTKSYTLEEAMKVRSRDVEEREREIYGFCFAHTGHSTDIRLSPSHEWQTGHPNYPVPANIWRGSHFMYVQVCMAKVVNIVIQLTTFTDFIPLTHYTTACASVALKTVLKINHASKDKIQLWLSVAVGFSSIILWLLLILLPLAQVKIEVALLLKQLDLQ